MFSISFVCILVATFFAVAVGLSFFNVLFFLAAFLAGDFLAAFLAVFRVGISSGGNSARDLGSGERRWQGGVSCGEILIDPLNPTPREFHIKRPPEEAWMNPRFVCPTLDRFHLWWVSPIIFKITQIG